MFKSLLEQNTKRYTETKDWATGTLQKTVFTSEEYTSGARPVTLVKSWMTKRGNFYFNKLNISVCICDYYLIFKRLLWSSDFLNIWCIVLKIITFFFHRNAFRSIIWYGGCLFRGRNCLPFASTWVRAQCFSWGQLCSLLYCLCCPIKCLYVL
jgi:hypothetical protein